MGKLFEELKRRKVFRVAAVYAVAAWVLIQVADTVLPALQMPQWTVSFVTVLFILGFIPTLIAAWAYEIIPDGVKPDAVSQSVVQASPPANQYLIYATFLLVLVVAGFQVGDRFLFGSDLSTAEAINGASGVTGAGHSITRTSLIMGQFEGTPGHTVAISADGQRVLYAIAQNGTRQWFLRDLGKIEPSLLFEQQSTADTSYAQFSPDGNAIAFTNEGLYRISIEGGTPQVIATDASPWAFDWEDDDTILYASRRGVFRVGARGGEPQRLAFPTSGDDEYYWVQGLPERRGILVAAVPRGVRHGFADIVVLDELSGELKTLVEEAYAPQYIPSGHLVYTRGRDDLAYGHGQLFVAPFDLESLELTGPEVPYPQPIAGGWIFAFSSQGRMVSLPDRSSFNLNSRNVYWVDRDGSEFQLNLPPQDYSFPKIAPDEERMSITIRGEGTGLLDVWTLDFERETLGRISFLGSAARSLWSPDGNTLMVGSRRGGIWQFDANGLSDPIPVTEPDLGFEHNPLAFAGEGSQLIFSNLSNGGAYSLSSISYQEELPPSPLLAPDNFDVTGAAISPDENWIAYASDETGRYEVYVRPYPNVNSGKWQISNQGGRDPHWRDDGNELVFHYVTDIDSFYAVAIDTEIEFTAGNPKLLFSGDYIFTDWAVRESNQFDVSGDHQRFILMRDVLGGNNSLEAETVALTVVENWFEELKQLAPTDPQ